MSDEIGPPGLSAAWPEWPTIGSARRGVNTLHQLRCINRPPVLAGWWRGTLTVFSSPAFMELASANTTMASERRDFVEWHRGRSPYVFWALDVDTPELRQALSWAECHLSGLLLDDYRRQPHVTLDLCGFPAASPGDADEFSVAWLNDRVQRLRAAGLAEFAIEIGGLSSFISAPYLDARGADASLATIRQCLADGSGNRLLGNYVPHCTVGLYAAAWPAGPVVERLLAFSGPGALRLAIKRISLMSYHPAEIAGPLSLLGDFWLASGRMAWYPASASLGFDKLPE